MVYIRRLAIQGFKSFGPKKVTIEFEKGLVVITGPNGGGKSNILDAIRFALGELSAHNLRVGRMSELVHDSPQSSGAKVSITLDNHDRTLPVDSPEVTITRRLEKSGESEYLLNGRQISRAELLTILSMSNIRPSGFNIVSQGSVTSIAEMNGVELRRIIEDISGIGEYERRKLEAEEQLKIADKNLAVAKAGTAEVKLRVYQLQRERNEAYRRMQVERMLSNIKTMRFRRALETLESELREVEQESAKLDAESSEIERVRNERLREREMIEYERIKTSEEIHRLEARLKELERTKELLRSKEISLTSHESRIAERLKSIESEIPGLEELLHEAALQLDSIREKLNNEGAKLPLLEEASNRLVKEIDEAKLRLDGLKKRLGELESRLKEEAAKRARMEKEAESLRVRIEEARRRGSSTDQSLTEVLEDVTRLLREIRCLEKKIWTETMELEQARTDVERLTGQLEGLNDSLNKILECERTLSSTLQEVSSTGLLGIDDDRKKLRDALVRLRGVYGFLDDYLTPKDESELRRIKAATSGWINSLIIESWRRGLEIAKIASQVGLTMKIISLDRVKRGGGPRIHNVTLKAPWAKKVLAHLLEGAVFSEDLEAPGKIGTRIVGPGGIVIHHDGKIEVYGDTAEEVLRNLRDEYNECVSLLNILRDASTKLREKINRLEDERKTLNERIMKLTSARNSDMEAVQRAKEDLTRALSRTLLLIVAKVENDREIKKYDERLKTILIDIERFGKPDDSESEALREELRVAEERVLDLQAKRKEIEMEIRDLRRLIEEYRREEASTLVRIEKMRQRLEEKGREREHLSLELSRVAEERGKTSSELSIVLSEIEKTSSSMEVGRRRLDELAMILSHIGQELTELERKAQEISNKRISIAVRRSQLESEMKRVRDELNTLESSDSFEFPEDAMEELEESLRQELAGLERVNQLAPQQYEEIIGNYKLRSTRIRELEEERAEIARFIAWLEEEKKSVFMSTFTRVSESFERYFSILTGGQAWLRLEDPENPLGGGVEMILRFPGKSARSSRSASGGEKSVAAVALLLALQGLTPADFYIFDEVDAHMDIQYSSRLAELFSEMSKKTQIIVITLKDVIAEKADQLVGVYIRNGESRIVKTKIEEVMESV